MDATCDPRDTRLYFLALEQLMTATTTDMTSFTVAQFVVMGIFALLAVAGILFGMRLKRRRLAAQREAEDNREAAGVPDAAVETIEEPAEHPAIATPLPVAPAPPPLGDPTNATPVAVSPPEPEPVIAQPQPEPNPVTAAVPVADDIRQLKGLGPKLAATLAELGITRVDQIAAMSPAELDALDARLGTFRGRPARDRWAEQARLLSTGDKAGYEAQFGKLGG
jgi:predicted flap endonuclease-1-like 5' DNA nuclease